MNSQANPGFAGDTSTDLSLMYMLALSHWLQVDGQLRVFGNDRKILEGLTKHCFEFLFHCEVEDSLYEMFFLLFCFGVHNSIRAIRKITCIHDHLSLFQNAAMLCP